MSLEQLQFWTPVMMVTAALAFIGLERIFPYNRGMKVLREGFWVDLIGYGLIQSYLLGLFFSWYIHALDGVTGMSRWKLVGDWPVWVQVLFFIVTHDFVTYWIHRTQHASPFLWRFHETHHSVKDVDWLAGIRSHSGEILIYQSFEYIPIILLGAAPEVPLYKALANSVYGMYIHSNLSWRHGPLLYLFNGPELHRWHHSNNELAAYDRNFATKFAIWDFLFGTVYQNDGKRAADYGPNDPNFPKGWLSQHWYALKPSPRATPSPAH